MEIFDFHAHIYPEKISQRAVQSIGEFYNLEMHGEGTATKLIENGSGNGITGYVVHSVAVTDHSVRTINDFISRECAEHSEFYGLGTIHADFQDKIAELQRMEELGLRGLKIHPDTQKFNMDDPRMFEVYEYLQENELPILIHCGDYRYDYSHPQRLCEILDRFPKLIVVAAHFGGWSVPDLALEYLRDKRCYMDTSSTFFMSGLKRAKELIRIYGAERMVFGTDFPMWMPSEELDKFMSMGLTERENELILCENTKRILKLNR